MSARHERATDILGNSLWKHAVGQVHGEHQAIGFEQGTGDVTERHAQLILRQRQGSILS